MIWHFLIAAMLGATIALILFACVGFLLVGRHAQVLRKSPSSKVTPLGYFSMQHGRRVSFAVRRAGKGEPLPMPEEMEPRG